MRWMFVSATAAVASGAGFGLKAVYGAAGDQWIVDPTELPGIFYVVMGFLGFVFWTMVLTVFIAIVLGTFAVLARSVAWWLKPGPLGPKSLIVLLIAISSAFYSIAALNDLVWVAIPGLVVLPIAGWWAETAPSAR